MAGNEHKKDPEFTQPRPDEAKNFTTTVTDAASVDLATAPSGKKGLSLFIRNDGASPVYVAFGVAAVVATGLKLMPKETYSASDVEISKIAAICATGENANVRGTLWCGVV